MHGTQVQMQFNFIAPLMWYCSYNCAKQQQVEEKMWEMDPNHTFIFDTLPHEKYYTFQDIS